MHLRAIAAPARAAVAGDVVIVLSGKDAREPVVERRAAGVVENGADCDGRPPSLSNFAAARAGKCDVPNGKDRPGPGVVDRPPKDSGGAGDFDAPASEEAPS